MRVSRCYGYQSQFLETGSHRLACMWCIDDMNQISVEWPTDFHCMHLAERAFQQKYSSDEIHFIYVWRDDMNSNFDNSIKTWRIVITLIFQISNYKFLHWHDTFWTECDTRRKFSIKFIYLNLIINRSETFHSPNFTPEPNIVC